MTIRAKLYAAIVLTVIGPLVTIAVALHAKAETGVVPAALVGVLAGLGVPDIEIYASVVALAVVLTLLLQALPARRLAGRLGLLET